MLRKFDALLNDTIQEDQLINTVKLKSKALSLFAMPE